MTDDDDHTHTWYVMRPGWDDAAFNVYWGPGADGKVSTWDYRQPIIAECDSCGEITRAILYLGGESGRIVPKEEAESNADLEGVTGPEHPVLCAPRWWTDEDAKHDHD